MLSDKEKKMKQRRGCEILGEVLRKVVRKASAKQILLNKDLKEVRLLHAEWDR